MGGASMPLLEACLNGGRSREQHPAYPHTREELAGGAVATQATEDHAVACDLEAGQAVDPRARIVDHATGHLFHAAAALASDVLVMVVSQLEAGAVAQQGLPAGFQVRADCACTTCQTVASVIGVASGLVASAPGGD